AQCFLITSVRLFVNSSAAWSESWSCRPWRNWSSIRRAPKFFRSVNILFIGRSLEPRELYAFCVGLSSGSRERGKQFPNALPAPGLSDSVVRRADCYEGANLLSAGEPD